MTDAAQSSAGETRETVIHEICRVFRERGDSWYAGEPVTQTEHALQAAWLAEQEEASSALIASALLHDYGHLLHGLGEDCAEQGVDDHHEELGAKRLAMHFGPAVTEPIRLHVPAKRYLCAVEPEYFAGLSPASVQSLQLQGGPFTPRDAESFIERAHAADAVRLRQWDDQAKVQNLETPGMAHFRRYLEAAISRG